MQNTPRATFPASIHTPVEPGGTEWLYQLERRAILPVKWLMCILCFVLVIARSPDYLPALSEFILLIFYTATNVVFSYLIYLRRITHSQLRPFSMLSFAIDVFVMAGFIYLTGGIHSDFFILFFLVILRGMGFFPSARINLLANIVVGFIYISTLFLAGFDTSMMYEQEFYMKTLLVVGVVLLSWFLIEIQSEQRQHLMAVNRRLLLERTYAENLLEAMTDGVIALDEQLHPWRFNAAARRILDLPEDSEPGSLASRIPEPLLKACRACIQSGKETLNEPLEITLEGRRPKALRVSVRELFDSAESRAGIVVIFEDLSALRQVEDQLLQSDKLASVGQLAAGVAHELGNPIGIIKSCAEYLSGRVNKLDTDDPLKNSVQEEVEVIASESTRCQRILKELLSYSSEEAIAMENVELAGVVRRAEGLVAYKIHSDRIALEADLPEGEVYVRGDTNLLIQALVNILLNAIDSIDGPGRVTVRVRSENAQVIMDIEDTGCGIPPDIQQRIFDPFYTTRDEGTGLGLAITQRIINRLGGTIEVHSQTDKGSLFRLCLPQGEQEESYSPEESALR